jgi:hypothetical protein
MPQKPQALLILYAKLRPESYLLSSILQRAAYDVKPCFVQRRTTHRASIAHTTPTPETPSAVCAKVHPQAKSPAPHGVLSRVIGIDVMGLPQRDVTMLWLCGGRIT